MGNLENYQSMHEQRWKASMELAEAKFMKVYITKYALSRGLYETEAVECEGFPGMIRTKDGLHFHGEGRDWARTKEDALNRAEEMKAAKIESLKKQIKKLEDMKF